MKTCIMQGTSKKFGGLKMAKKVLENKPLVEAIFELRWEPQERAPKIRMGPHYKILIG